MAMAMPKMNMSPPMVGVPCLFLCQLGPTSRMVWPNFSLCRKGMIHFPSSAVTAKAMTETSKYSMVSIVPTPLVAFPVFSHFRLAVIRRHCRLFLRWNCPQRSR